MRSFRYLIGSVALFVALLGCAAKIKPIDKFLQSPTPPIRYEPEQPVEWVLPNGLTVLFKADDELPLVSGALYLRGGSYWQGPEEIGSAVALGSLMREGGAGELSPLELDAELLKLAATISSSFSKEYGAVKFSSLASDLDTVFALFADVVLRPRFDEGRLDLWRAQLVQSITHRTDDANTVAQLSFLQLLYGDTPYGRFSLSSTVPFISGAKIREMYARFVRPSGAILALTGRMNEQEARRLVEKYFLKWRGDTEPLPPLPEVPERNRKGIYFIELPFTQSAVWVGQLGVPRFTDDYIAIDAFNDLFGGSAFNSRLFKKVRSELGLAYSVWGGISPDVMRGSNAIVLQTKAASTGKALVASLDVLAELRTSLAEAGELRTVKDAAKNSFVFNFNSPSAILARVAQQRILGYPEDYDATYINKIDQLTLQDIREVAKKRWDPGALSIIVVGNAEARLALEQTIKESPKVLEGYTLRDYKFGEKLEGIDPSL